MILTLMFDLDLGFVFIVKCLFY